MTRKLIFILLLTSACTPKYEGEFSDWIGALTETDSEKQAIALQDFWFDHPEMPLVEDSVVTFLFHNPGHQPIGLIGDVTSWNLPAIPMERILETDFYQCRLVLPDSACLEYQFYLKGRLIPDPKNKKSNRTTHGVHSVLYMPRYQFPLQALADRKKISTAPDTVEYKEGNKFIFYAPDRYRPIHLLLFIQGESYLKEGQVQVIIENLRSAGGHENFAALFCTGSTDQADPAEEIRHSDEVVKAFAQRFPSLQIEAVTLAAHSVTAWKLLELLPQLGIRPRHLILQSPQFDAERIPVILSQARNVNSIAVCYGSLSPSNKSEQLVRDLQSRTRARAFTAAEGDNWQFWRKTLIRSLDHIQKQDVK